MPSGMLTDPASSNALIAIMVVVFALAINGIVGKQGPLTTVRGVIVSGFVLTAVLYGLTVAL